MGYCVFEYQPEISIESVRESLVDLIRQCLESRGPITKAEFEVKIPKLHYGTYPTRAEKNMDSSLDALLWKYSELTGKYCGCPFWSDGARRRFEGKLLEYTNGRIPTSNDARHIAYYLKKKIHNEYQLVHEHVFPRAELRKRLLLDRDTLLAAGSLAETLERTAIGCIVLRSEDKQLKNDERDYNNPWLRYRGKLKLVENQDWPASQRELIVAAGLL